MKTTTPNPLAANIAVERSSPEGAGSTGSAQPNPGSKQSRRSTGEVLALWLAARAKALNEFGGPVRGTLVVPIAWLLVALIAAADFAMGFEITLRFFYLVPLVLMAAARGTRPAVVMALLCDICWVLSDFVSGANYSSVLVPLANVLITLGIYLIVIWLLGGLLSLHREMERRVAERTAALTEEMAERGRLEREIISISERERWSVGHDLHDGLGQHFTATAMAAQSLARGLEDEGHASTADSYRLVKMIEDGIGQTRRLAKGLLLVTVEADQLADALREMAVSSAEQFRVPCELRIGGNIEVSGAAIATHLFRIAQEAVHNASRHAGASRVELRVTGDAIGIVRTIRDDGTGVPPSEARGAGMGLRIMAHRAKVIGADFDIRPADAGGTLVECIWHRAPHGEAHLA